MTSARKVVPEKTLKIPIAPDGNMEATGAREVPFITTRTPGVVITPAQNVYSRVSFNFGCNLTHAPSGFRIGGTFHDVRVARLVAAALGGIMDWNGRDMTDSRAVVVSVRSALSVCPQLLNWLASLNDWNVEGPKPAKGSR